MKECFYCPGIRGLWECPLCHNFYCEECHEMFLPIDNLFPNGAKMCSQCHYDVYEKPKFEEVE